MNKETLRSLFLEKRKTLTGEELSRRNSLLFANTIDFLQDRSTLIHHHIFLPIDRFNEPDTRPVFDRLLNDPSKKVYLSKTDMRQKKLSHFHITTETVLATSKYGIPEPVNGTEVNTHVLDLVFVPLISCDRQGNRIGYGAGLYDRFLQETNNKCIKVGLGITPPLDNIDYTSEHDIPLDFFISHLGIEQFSR